MSKLSYYIGRLTEKVRIKAVKKQVDLSGITLISQNCIGGVMYHDCEAQFLSPTINLFIKPDDFMRFVSELDKYLTETPRVYDTDKYPIGEFLDGLKIYFMHYKSAEEALAKWETRKKRIIREKIFVICIERDGFDEKNYEQFCKIGYKKILFTRNKEWSRNADSVYIKKYRNEAQVPDLIPLRKMYYKNKLPKAVKKAFDK